MFHPVVQPSADVFPHARVWSILRATPETVALLIILAVAVTVQSAWPLLVAPIMLGFLLRHTLRHATEMLLISGYTITIYQGTLNTHAIDLPIWRISLETRQTPIGRMLDYGCVRIKANGTWYELEGVDNLYMLRSLIAQRQNELVLASRMLLVSDDATAVTLHSI